MRLDLLSLEPFEFWGYDTKPVLKNCCQLRFIENPLQLPHVFFKNVHVAKQEPAHINVHAFWNQKTRCCRKAPSLTHSLSIYSSTEEETRRTSECSGNTSSWFAVINQMPTGEFGLPLASDARSIYSVTGDGRGQGPANADVVGHTALGVPNGSRSPVHVATSRQAAWWLRILNLHWLNWVDRVGNEKTTIR